MDSVWLILALPLLGSLFCATHYRSVGKTLTGCAASAAILGAFLASMHQWKLLASKPEGFFQPNLGAWLKLPGIHGLDFAALIDPLSATMLCTVTGVAFLIHCFAMGYMADEEEYGRFFASMNLFVATMVLLILANNLGLLLVGWGGVGYASYSLIGFYRNKPSAVSAARKAFLINVVGDVGIMLALFLIANRTGRADFKGFLDSHSLALLGPDVLYAGVFLLIGAYAKSAQQPLHPWLPDAMEGPTPVSALIHAATMVTAGVYLVVRCAPLFAFGAAATTLMPIIAIFGAITAITAAMCAIVQNDLKRILAYSTMSQLGYMFMAAGVGAYGAAIFHLVTHAFFKALLFLTAGVVIHAQHGEQDITKMGNLGKRLPIAHLCFALGSIALAGIPPLAGFWSKEAILMATFDAPMPEAKMLWGVGIVTALLTAYYTGRAWWLTFWAPAKEEHALHLPSSSMIWPLAVLSVFTVLSGFVHHNFIWTIQGGAEPHEHGLVGLPQMTAITVAVGGVLLAWSLHRSGRATVVPSSLEPVLRGCEAIDGLYKAAARPFRRLADTFALQVDAVPSRLLPDLLSRSLLSTSGVLCQLQGGSLRLYAMALLAAAALLVLFVYGLVILSGGTAQ